jgi:ERO1-like protein alpha
MCRLRDCSVCECPESEFPEVFKKPLSQYNPVCQEGKPQATVDRTLDTRAFRGWTVTDNPWTSDDETDNDEMTYVNLRLNPERYTGYIGPSARRIWEAIYSENCPKRKLHHIKVFLVFSICFFILLFSKWLINSYGCLNSCNYTGFYRYI